MSYTFTHKNKKVTLPDFKDLPAGAIRKARKLPPEEQMWVILEEVLDEKNLAIVDTLSISELGSVMNGWTQGAPLGESLKSSD